MLPRFISRLSGKLLAMTILFVLLAEAVIFIPSAASFRQDWFQERAESAGHVTLALAEVPDSFNRKMLSDKFMVDTDISMVATEMMGQSLLVLGEPPDTTEFEIIDLRGASDRLELSATLAAFNAKTGYFRVLTTPPASRYETMEFIVPRASLQKAMENYCHRILGLSIIIALITGTLLYLVLSWVIIRPIQCLADDIEEFREDPAAPIKSKKTGTRRNEIGDLSRSFTEMQQGIQTSLEQRKRLADLGLAVSKINHDLRNVLTSAQLVSDRLAMDKDERVKKMGERLVRAVDRGVRIAEGVLDYGQDKNGEAVHLEETGLYAIAEEAAKDTLRAFPGVSLKNKIEKSVQIKADTDHTYRIFQNLIRNAAQAMAETPKAQISLSAASIEGAVSAQIADNGPGLPEKTRDNLFTPFIGSSGKGRTGLGLAISKELASAQGGDLSLKSTGKAGTVFLLTFG